MTTLTDSVPAHTGHLPTTPSRGRRVAIAITGFLTCAMPAVFAFNVARMLLTGAESDHRFHQVTGQGLLLCALWLGALVPLVRAGWQGRRPSTAPGLRHLAFVATGAICATFADGGGAPILLAVIGIPGALLWLALPKRPRLRSAIEIDPVLAPVALLAAAFLTPYVVSQLDLQNATTSGYHSENPHYFDMAWLAGTLTVLAVLSALLPAARSLLVWVAGSTVVLGVAGLCFGEGVTWSLLALGLGVLAGAGATVRGSLGRRSSGSPSGSRRNA
jgi:hypothetical protein